MIEPTRGATICKSSQIGSSLDQWSVEQIRNGKRRPDLVEEINWKLVDVGQLGDGDAATFLQKLVDVLRDFVHVVPENLSQKA